MKRFFIPELFKMRGSQTGYLLELGGKMRYTAVVHLVGTSENRFAR